MLHHKEPLSPRTAVCHSRYRDAEKHHGVCLYCAIGCGLNIYTYQGEIVGVEGDDESPVNRGRLCPKGSNTLQMLRSPHRVATVRYRAPYATQWEDRPMDWAMDRIARLMKVAREAGFQEKNAAGMPVNTCHSIASLGGSASDNEENYLMKKLFTGGLGMLDVENQARL